MPGLRLEPFDASHLPIWAELTRDSDMQRFTSVPQPPLPGYVDEWFTTYEEGRRDGTREVFVVVAEDDSILGVGVAFLIDRTGRTLELGYAILPALRGRGVATGTLRALTDWAFSDLGALRVELRINVDNPASKRVAERCGYVFEGVLRSMPLKPGRRGDLEVWSRLPSDP